MGSTAAAKVTKVPLVRSRPGCEDELRHNLLQPESVCDVVEGEFHTPGGIRSHKIIFTMYLWTSECHCMF